ncbi:MAG: MFS transporter, partial [Clostridia bacterium]|nr:MFS transporter [Clostridia bacterium]
IADRIGRKWTISAGLCVTVIAMAVMCFVMPTGNVVGKNGEFSFPALLYAVWVIKGFGMALVHNCSFPMVVELCSNNKIGKFTGYYYAASMSAQTVTPVLLGLVFMASGQWGALPIYASVLFALSACVFMSLVKNVKAKKVENARGLEALDND